MSSPPGSPGSPGSPQYTLSLGGSLPSLGTGSTANIITDTSTTVPPLSNNQIAIDIANANAQVSNADLAEISKIDPIDSAPGSAVGDPYVQTLSGSVYKMPNFQGFSRMLQGTQSDKRLTVNVRTSLTTQEEADEAQRWVEATVPAAQLATMGDYLDHGEAFMRQLWVQYGADVEFSVNMDTLQVTGTYQGVSTDTEQVAFPGYLESHHECAGSVEIQLGDGMAVVCSKYDNPQIRTGFRLVGGEALQAPHGAMVHRMYQKDMQLKRLTDTTPLQRQEDRPGPRRVKEETYLDYEGVRRTKKVEVY